MTHHAPIQFAAASAQRATACVNNIENGALRMAKQDALYAAFFALKVMDVLTDGDGMGFYDLFEKISDRLDQRNGKAVA